MLKYTIFSAKWGYFGILGDQEGLIATSLPAKTVHVARKNLLVGMYSNVKIDHELFLNVQKKITAYYTGSYVDFTEIRINQKNHCTILLIIC